MINRIDIKIPYPKKVGFISINFKKRVFFSFDNLSLFIFREDNKIETSKDLTEWQKQHPQFDMFVHAAYSAAKSYCMHERKPFKLDLNKFALGLAQLKKEELNNLIEVWKRSQTYGSANPPGKKKAVKH